MVGGEQCTYPKEGINGPVNAVIRVSGKFCKQIGERNELAKRNGGISSHLLQVNLQKLT